MPARRWCPRCGERWIPLDADICRPCADQRDARDAWTPAPQARAKLPRDPRDLLAVPMSVAQRAAVDAALRGRGRNDA